MVFRFAMCTAMASFVTLRLKMVSRSNPNEVQSHSRPNHLLVLRASGTKSLEWYRVIFGVALLECRRCYGVTVRKASISGTTCYDVLCAREISKQQRSSPWDIITVYRLTRCMVYIIHIYVVPGRHKSSCDTRNIMMWGTRYGWLDGTTERNGPGMVAYTPSRPADLVNVGFFVPCFFITLSNRFKLSSWQHVFHKIKTSTYLQ